jgi:hypothetical protein
LTHVQDDIFNELAESLKYPMYSYESALLDYKNSMKPIKTHVSMFEHIQKHSSFYRSMLTERELHERVTQVIRTEVLRFRDSAREAAFIL